VQEQSWRQTLWRGAPSAFPPHEKSSYGLDESPRRRFHEYGTLFLHNRHHLRHHNYDSRHFAHLQVASVMNIYWHEYFQRAVDTANASNTPGKPPIFKYTSHSFLLDLFFNCPATMGLHCDEPDADDVSGGEAEWWRG
jgi:hypothetical protein